LRQLGLLARLLVIAACLLFVQDPRALDAAQAVSRGDLALRQGRIAEAASDYNLALAAQPNDATILARLVDTALAAHRPDLAAIYIKYLATQSGWAPKLRQQMADVLAAQGERHQAAIYLQAALTGTRNDLPILRKLIDYALADRDWPSATTRLTQLIALQPDDERSLYQLGLLLAPTNTSTALAYLQQAAIDPQYRPAAAAIQSVIGGHSQDSPAELSFQIGLALMSLRAWPYAEHALNVALDRGTNNPAALAFLGVTQDQQGYDGWTMIDRAFASAPDDPMVNFAVALHWRLAGDAQKALTALARAQPLAPNNAGIAAEIGLSYQMLGRLTDAAAWLNKAVALAPGDPGFRTLLATFYADSNYSLEGEGLDVLRRLAVLSPNDADVRASLGWALFSTRQFDAARNELEKALVLDPTNLRARFYFGAVLEFRGDRDGAIDAYLYVYRANGVFRDLAAGALKRLGLNT
jgi:tetratricopeptide (TPR) repeat protein